MTLFSETIGGYVAFKPKDLDNTFGEVLVQHGKTQLRIAETEKYAHVTYFSAADGTSPWKARRGC